MHLLVRNLASLTLACLTLASSGLCPIASGEELHAEKIIAWEFQRSEDRNIDQWPDGWRRRAGRDFPAYIPIRIVARDAELARAAREAEPVMSKLWMKYQTGRYLKDFISESTPEPIAQLMDRFVVNNCLSIDMDGGSVQLESPAFLLDSRFTYTLEGAVTSRGLDGHHVWIELLLLDDQDHEISSSKTVTTSGTTNWHSVATGSVSSEALKMGQVVVHIDPLKTNRLGGNVRIDEIRLYRMPKLDLKVNVPYHVAAVNEEVDVSCAVLGIADVRSTVHFKLIDHLGNVCQETHAPLTQAKPLQVADLEPMPSNSAAARAAAPGTAAITSESTSGKPRGGKFTSTQPMPETTTAVGAEQKKSVNSSSVKSLPPFAAAANVKDDSHLDGEAHWQLHVPEPGFYRIIVDLGRRASNAESRSISRETSLAISDGSRAGVGGPFGWSLPDFDAQFTPEAVPELVKLGGAGWLKIPVWFNGRDVQTAERLSLLLERLDLRKVHCVGILDRLPDKASNRAVRQPAAAVFSVPAEWEPELEPALTRMSMKLDWFQLGRDQDRSFIGNPNLIPLVTDIRNRMQNYSQELQLALAWDYQDPIPKDKNLPWRASQMSSEPQLTAKELRSYLATPGQAEHTRWVTLNPIPASRYRTLDRVRDLTERMIAVKENKVEAGFLTTPIDRETGIFNPDNSVGELFLPWRVLNQHLAGSTYLGTFTMPGGSTNFVFREGQTGFMILWNDRVTVEQLYLGDHVKATDLWGRTIHVEQVKSDHNTPEQRLNVNAWPILVSGINVPVAQWRMRFKLENKRLPSTLAARTTLPISMENTLGQSAFGTVALHSPSLLQSGMQGARLQLAEGREERLDLPIPMRSDASAGKHLLRFDFQMNAEQELNFSTYESLTLGIGDVELNWEMTDIAKDHVALRVELTNSNPQPVSFDCRLFPPQHPYRRYQIMNAPSGTTQRDFVLPIKDIDPEAILFISCEEIGTGRVLNYRLPLKVGE